MINKAVQFEIMSVTTMPDAAAAADVQIPWKRLPSPFALGRHFHAAAVVRKEDNNGSIGILQVGGRNHETGEAVSSVEFLEPNLNEWWNIAPLSTKRSGCAVAAMSKTVFVVGGADSESRVLSTAETWTFGSIQESSWQELPNAMNEPRWFCAAVGLERRAKVIVVGGRNEKWEPLKSVEAYDVRQNTWENLPPMPTARFGCAAVLLGNSRMMVIGGHDGQNALNTCHVYQIEDEEWHTMPPMPIAFAFCSAAVVTNVSRYVFVSGKTMDQVRDHSDNSGNNIIQCYCEQNRKWTVLRTSEHIDAGPLLFIGTELITIGGPRKGAASTVPKAVCRKWNVSNVNFAALCNERSSSLSTAAVFEEDGQSHHNSSSQNIHRLGSIDERSLRSDSSRPQRSGGGHTRTTSAGSSAAPTPVAIPIAVEVTRQDSFESGPAAALHVESIQSSPPFRPPASLNNRREIRQVSDFPIEDVHGESAWYSGDLCTRTNKPHGRGRMRWDFSGEVYDGEWRDGLRHGLGLTHFTSTNDSHEGVYHEGKKHGTGKFKWRDGREYEGNFVNDFSEDKNGKLVWRDGRKYIGQFIKGERTGRGVMEFPNGDVYDGYFVNGRYEGFGVLKFHDGRVYEGQWRGNQANGNGILKSRDGETLHEGWWENDRPARGS